MKKTFASLALAIIFTFTAQPAHATSWFTGATIFNQIIDNVVQAVTEYYSKMGSIPEIYQKYKNDILDPLANVLIAQAQQKAAQDLIVWANGGFRGTPSFVSNPAKFIKNAGLAPIKNATLSINLTDPYANSILQGVIKSYRSTDSTEQQLANLAVSQVPVLLQDNVCKEQMLVKLATDQTKNRDGTTNYSAMIAQKTELYRTLCAGDPLRDPVLARKLKAMNDQNSGLAGLDGILVVSGGENAYNRSTRGIYVARQASAEAQQASMRDTQSGGGLSSKTKCVKFGPADAAGNRACDVNEVVAPSGLVQNSTAKAQGAGLDRLGNIQGAGALSNFLTGFATIIISQAIKGAIAGSNEPDVNLAITQDPATLTRNSTTSTSTGYTAGDVFTNTSIITRVSVAYTQDLLREPASKTSLLKPLLKELKESEKILSQLDTLDTLYVSEFAAYANVVSGGRDTCNQVAITMPFASTTPEFLSASSTINNRFKRVSDKKIELATEQANIQKELELIATTTAQYNASFSSQQIGDIHQAYADAMEAKNYPTYESLADRTGDYSQTKEDTKNDLSQANPVGAVYTAISTCNSYLSPLFQRGG